MGTSERDRELESGRERGREKEGGREIWIDIERGGGVEAV